MSATTDKLLALAASYEAKAAALRLAAAELNGHQTTQKQAGLAGALAAATALRAAQRQEAADEDTTVPRPRARTQAIAEVIRACLAQGPQTRGTVGKALEQAGLSLTPSGVLFHLQHYRPKLIRIGVGSSVRWQLEPAAEPTTPTQRKATKPQRTAKWQKVLTILHDAGRPLPVPELAEAARAVGVTTLTGIAHLVKLGYLAKRKTRDGVIYRFKAWPPDPDAAD